MTDLEKLAAATRMPFGPCVDEPILDVANQLMSHLEEMLAEEPSDDASPFGGKRGKIRGCKCYQLMRDLVAERKPSEPAPEPTPEPTKPTPRKSANS